MRMAITGGLVGILAAVSGCDAGSGGLTSSTGSGPGGGGAGGAPSSTSSAVTTSTSSASTTTSSSTGGGTTGCSSLPLCDDFEGVTVGGPPDPARWSVISPNCGGTGAVSVDGSQAHSGGKSLMVTGKGGYCNHVFIANTTAIAGIGAVVYGRFFLRLSDPLGGGHTTFLAMKDQNDGGKDLRMGGQDMILMYNRESDDATLPALSPAGTALSVQPPAQQWLCVEFMIDGAQSGIQTWVDGQSIQGLIVDGTPTPDVDQQWLSKAGWKPSLTDFKLGWESYAGQDMTLWFDDVALGPQRIGCQ